MSESYIIFTASDIDYLINNFNLAQLRAELRNARPKAVIDETYYWPDYVQALGIAIDIVDSMDKTFKKTAAQNGFQARPDASTIKLSVTIQDIVSRYIPVKHLNNKTSKCVCPFHADTDPSMVIYHESQTFHCFGCQRGGDVIEFVQLIENCDFNEALSILIG